MKRKDEFKVKFLKHPIPVYQYTWTSLKLRAEKSVIAEVLTVIPSHTKFEVIDADSLWLKVMYQGQVGYVFKQPVSITVLYETNLVSRYETI